MSLHATTLEEDWSVGKCPAPTQVGQYSTSEWVGKQMQDNERQYRKRKGVGARSGKKETLSIFVFSFDRSACTHCRPPPPTPPTPLCFALASLAFVPCSRPFVLKNRESVNVTVKGYFFCADRRGPTPWVPEAFIRRFRFRNFAYRAARRNLWYQGYGHTEKFSILKNLGIWSQSFPRSFFFFFHFRVRH